MGQADWIKEDHKKTKEMREEKTLTNQIPSHQNLN
jgi:hypothetical protein